MYTLSCHKHESFIWQGDMCTTLSCHKRESFIWQVDMYRTLSCHRRESFYMTSFICLELYRAIIWQADMVEFYYVISFNHSYDELKRVELYNIIQLLTSLG